MAKIVDKNGNEIVDPDLEKGYLTPLETVHHDAKTHKVETKLPGGTIITSTVVDGAAYDEVTVYLYTENPAPEPTADELAEGLAEVADMAATNSIAVEEIYIALAELGELIGG